MTLYLAHTHQRRQTPGAHRKPTRWTTITGWIRRPRKAK